MADLKQLEDLNRLADEMAVFRTAPVTVIVIIPTRGECQSGFMYDLVRTVYQTAVQCPHIKMKFVKGSSSILHNLRNELANKVLESGCEWSWWLDDDQRFPVDSLVRLLSHNKDIVGANYVTRTAPPKPTALMCSPDGMDYYKLPTLPADTGLAPADALGMGCCLIRSEVFRKLDRPFFSMPYVPHLDMHVGEDVFMMAQAIGKGFQPFIDHDLSREVKHTGSVDFTWDHYYAYKIMEQQKAEQAEAEQPKLITES